MRYKIDLTGQHYGRLTVKEFDYDKNKWLCQCECGGINYVSSQQLKSGKTKSCDCLPTIDTLSTDNAYGTYSWLSSYDYEEVGQEEPESFVYQDKFLVYRCGRTVWEKVA